MLAWLVLCSFQLGNDASLYQLHLFHQMKTYNITYCAHPTYDPTIRTVKFQAEAGFEIDQVWDLFKVRHGGHVLSVKLASGNGSRE
jgi:hypothetical protein